MEHNPKDVVRKLEILKVTLLEGYPNLVDYLIESVKLRVAEHPQRYESYPEDCMCPNCTFDIASYRGSVNNCPYCGKEIDFSSTDIVE